MPNQHNGGYWVYVLLCEGNNYYTGVAKDVRSRFKAHLHGRGAKYTRSFKPVKIVYIESHQDRSSAQRREAEIKKLTHNEKSMLKLI